MTQPQQDPASDVGAALARLAEQTFGLQRQVNRLEDQAHEAIKVRREELVNLEQHIAVLTDAKFVTYRTLIDSQAEKVALALDATEKAIGKAEVATGKAIDKAEAANDVRFASVNEFRAQLADQARTFMPRTEAVNLAEQSFTRLREMAEQLPALATRAEVLIMADRYSERIGELNDRLNRMEAHGVGAKENKTGIYAAIGAAVAILSILVITFNLLAL